LFLLLFFILREYGNGVYFPTVTGLGERIYLVSKDIDLYTRVHDINQVLEYEDLEVILVGHS
jgi:hypothetical protein